MGDVEPRRPISRIVFMLFVWTTMGVMLSLLGECYLMSWSSFLYSAIATSALLANDISIALAGVDAFVLRTCSNPRTFAVNFNLPRFKISFCYAHDLVHNFNLGAGTLGNAIHEYVRSMMLNAEGGEKSGGGFASHKGSSSSSSTPFGGFGQSPRPRNSAPLSS